ncbi:hypothetical protein HRbin36_00184 [bacterium HR36]|nr:hypothetical protein HRbin36_00184 [bacterium HR36]
MTEAWRFEAGQLVVETQGDVAHRLLAASGPYRLVAVLNPTRADESPGVVYLAHEESADFPAWQPPLFSRPADVPAEMAYPDALALGPIYREADNSWLPLAGLPSTWFDATLEVLQGRGESLRWAVETKVYGGPSLTETFCLTPGGLQYSCSLRWTIPGFRVQLPAFATDGQRTGLPQCRGTTFCLQTSAWLLVVECLEPEDANWDLEAVSTAATGHYARVVLQSRSTVHYRLQLQLTC